MTHSRLIAMTALALGLMIIAAFTISAENRDAPLAAVSFSEDERTVNVRYGEREWTFARPVVSPWKFPEQGRIYWVSPGGDDSEKGTQEKPLRSIGAAYDRASAGEIVYVKAGTYVENLFITKSGREGRPIVLSCAPGELGKVMITPSEEFVRKNPGRAVIMIGDGARHVWINGFVIEGPRGRPEAPKSETFGANGITWSNKAGFGCRATNNVVYHNVHCGMKEMGHGGTNILIEGNVIFGNGTNGQDHGLYLPCDEVTVNGNLIFEHPGFGVHSYSSPKRQVVTRNICFGNKVCGILVAGSENKVYNNISTGNDVGIYYFRRGCMNNDVRNNIFAFNRVDCGYDNGGGKLGDPSGNKDDFNCYFPGKPAKELDAGAHEVLADPQFLDAKKGDYRLAEKSPCRGAGTDVGLTTSKSPDLGPFIDR